MLCVTGSNCTACDGGCLCPSEASDRSCVDVCPARHYCPPGSVAASPCPDGASSRRGAASCTIPLASSSSTLPMVLPIAVSVGGIVVVAAVAGVIIWRRRHRMPVIPFAELKQVQRLGAGHFGEVSQARWRSHARVAVKQSNVRCSDGAAIATERRRLEAIPQHAHVVRVYGICVDAPERGLCIVMELGVCSLEWLLQNPRVTLGRPSSSAVEPFDAATALSIAQQVAEGLMHVHRSGVVHRDVRAANVLIVSTQPLRVVLADFGLSQRIARRRPAVCCSPCSACSPVQSASVSPTSSTAVTDVGYDARHRASVDLPPSARKHAKVVVGPVQWTAPEVLTGHVQGVTTASDVYMFGGLLFEMLTGGQHPYFWVNGECYCCGSPAALLALCALALTSVLSRVSLCRGVGFARGSSSTPD
jgi:hypothetical protein